MKGPFDERRRAMSRQDTHTNGEMLIQGLIFISHARPNA